MANGYLGEIEYRNGNSIKALKHLQNLLIVYPNEYEIHLGLSVLFDELNKKKEATYHYERAVELQRAK